MNSIYGLNSLLESSTIAETDEALSRILSEQGCDKFSYNYYPANFQQMKNARHVICAEPVSNWQHYYTFNQFHLIDPILKRMRKSHFPFGWRLEEERSKYGKEEKRLFSDAIEFGLHGGFAVPIHASSGEFANLVIQDVDILRALERYPYIKANLQLIAYCYHSRISNFISLENVTKCNIQLTQREMECLYLTSQHKTAKEIAKSLNITPRTVGFHIENIIKKMSVKNKYQAISIAAQLGLLL